MRRSLLFFLIFSLSLFISAQPNQREEINKKLALQNADFTVEYATNLSELDSWSDNTKFQWKAVDHGVIDNAAEMQRLVDVVKDAAPKDTVGFYKQFFDARDNQYIVLRVDGGHGERLFHVRVTNVVSTDDPKMNASKTFSTRDYIYISPPRGEQQLEIKVWPNSVGEELAKTYTFRGHSYGARGARSVMLDRSRLVPGRYDLQYVKMDDETAKTDTVTISDLQPGKLYTFYTYLLNPIVEAWLKFDGFKRMRIDVNDWAEDLVTHFDDRSAIVMTGGQMPFLKHKWLEAPNPSYLDTRLFAPHDSLWLNVFKDNIQLTEAKDLVINVSLLNLDGTVKESGRIPWGQKGDRFFVVNCGDPCVIETYIKGYVPKVTHCRGAYNPTTGWLYEDEHAINIYLESTRMEDNGVHISKMNLTALEPVDAKRDEYYLANIQRIDVLNEPLTSIVSYDEFASRQGFKKYVDGHIIEQLASLAVTFSASKTALPGDRVYLKKDKSAEENKIKIESVEGEARRVNYPYFDYVYWDVEFSLLNYLDPGDSGRPYIAIDDKVVRKLPILNNNYIDIDAWKKRTEEDAKKKLNPDSEGSSKGQDFLNGFNDLDISFKFPLAPPPCYIRTGLNIDLVKTKKISFWAGIGIGVDFDFLDREGCTKKWKDGYEGVPNGSTGRFNTDKIDIRSTDENGLTNAAKWKDIANKFSDEEEDPFTAKAAVHAELFTQFSIPTNMKLEDFPGLRFFDELNINAKASLNLGAKLSVLSFADWVAKKMGAQRGLEWLTENTYAKKVIKALDSGLEINLNTLLTAKAGIYYYDDGTYEINPLKTHLVGMSAMARVDFSTRLGLKFDVVAAGIEAGVLGCAGVYIKGSMGDRMWFDRPFKGAAWSYRAGLGLYYKVHALFWNKHDELMLGGSEYKPAMLLGNQTNSNPYHEDYKSYMATGKEKKMPRRINRRLPGTNVTTNADMIYPVRFLSGGDSIIFKTDAASPNDRHLRVVSTGNPVIVSDYQTGGSANYHSASSPNFDIVVYEQASRKLKDTEIAPNDNNLVDCVIRNGSISKIYYTIKKAGGKWYRPKPIDASNHDANTKPRVALDDKGNAAAIWQQGYYTRNPRLSTEEQNNIENLLFNGNLMYSRFDGTNWSEPVSILRLNRKLQLTEYQISYNNGEAFIAATELLPEEEIKPVFIHVTADGQTTVADAPMEQNSLFELCRVGNHNVVAQLSENGSDGKRVRIALNSYDMQGQPDGQLCTSVSTGNDDIGGFRLVADQNARSLRNIGLMWTQTTLDATADTTYNEIRAARLIPNGQTVIVGTPLTMARLAEKNQVYAFDGYMTNEKITGCYLVNDDIAGTQINRVAAYFSNAFSYTVQFDLQDNQTIVSSAEKKAQTTFLVKVSNLGTSTINRCMLTVEDVQDSIPLHLVIPAGMTAQERVTIPYESGKAINTKLTVTYDDILGLQAQQLPRFLARREKRAHARRMGKRYADAYSHEDVIYEQQTRELFPDIPELECYPLSHTVDDHGNNRIVLRVKNVSSRPMPPGYIVTVQMSEESDSPRLNANRIGAAICAQNVLDDSNSSNKAYLRSLGVGFFEQSNNCELEDVVVEIPEVTETKPMFIRTIVKGFDPNLNFVDITGGNRNREYAIVTVYPSNETTAVEKVYNDGDADATLRISVNGNTVKVSGAQPGQDIRLYLSNGMILARQKADTDGIATFNMPPVRRGLFLVSNDKETIKFNF